MPSRSAGFVGGQHDDAQSGISGVPPVQPTDDYKIPSMFSGDNHGVSPLFPGIDRNVEASMRTGIVNNQPYQSALPPPETQERPRKETGNPFGVPFPSPYQLPVEQGFSNMYEDIQQEILDEVERCQESGMTENRMMEVLIDKFGEEAIAESLE